MVTLVGFDGVGIISMAMVVAVWSSSVGCMRQYLLLASSQSNILASCS